MEYHTFALVFRSHLILLNSEHQTGSKLSVQEPKVQHHWEEMLGTSEKIWDVLSLSA